MASLKSYDANLIAYTDSTVTPKHGQRRRHNFGDRVYKLAPQETPFFAYLNAVGKMPTDDPVFRVLEDRAPTKWADRTFQTASVTAGIITPGATADDAWAYDADGSGSGVSSASIPVVADQGAELVAGMLVQAIVWDSTGDTPQQGTALITAVSGDTVQLKTIQTCTLFGSALSANADVDFQVIGTAFGEGTVSPDSFGYDMDDTYGLTQIFKTSAYMSNTAMATALRGYSSEWDRIWSLKLREHKVDIERAFLFNNKGTVDSVQYTDGIIGNIIKNAGSWETDDSAALSYSKNKSYARIVDISQTSSHDNEATYDRFLKDFEIIFAPERGGSDQKFCMASLPVITYFNQMKNGFMQGSANSTMRYNLDFSDAEGGLGHKVMKVETVHGTLAIVKNPLLRGIGKSMMVGVDLDNIKYRPLVGNGVNRDTYIDTNVQTPDEDSRKDLILTEAGLEVCMPESHFLYQFTSGTTPIG
jgi:hypothetical protein